MGLIIAIHVIACALLIIIILIQRGRGAGLVESFSGVESMFGTKTNEFLTRTTTVLSILFFFTCLSLAFLSAQQSKSLMKSLPQQTQTPQTPLEMPKLDTSTQGVPTQEVPKQEAPAPEIPKEEAPKTE